MRLYLSTGFVLALLGQPALADQTALDTLTTAYQEIADLRLLDGTVEAVNQATISAETSGRIEAILYDVEDYVPQNAVIIRFRDRDQKAAVSSARANLEEARARLQQAEAEYRRIKNIYERKLVSKSKLDQATAAYKAAKARLASSRGALDRAEEQLEHTRVRAPYAGIVTKRHVEVGEAVNIGQPLISGLSLEQLRVNVQVPQRFMDRVRKVKQAQIFTDTSDGPALVSEQLTLFPVADTLSHSFRVRIELPAGQHDLYPGMLVKAGFPLAQRKALLIPASALVERSELTALYVYSPQGQLRLRQVRVGRRQADKLEILAGLEAGEKIALNPISAGKLLKQQAGNP